MEEKQVEVKPWMLVLLVIAALICLFGFDPAGNAAEKWFGKRAANIIAIVIMASLIVSFFTLLIAVGHKHHKAKKQ